MMRKTPVTALAALGLALGLCGFTSAAPFPADSGVYVAHRPGAEGTMQLYRVDRGAVPYALHAVGGPVGHDYNAIAFNPLDGYIYAIERDGPGGGIIYRIDDTGAATSLGKPAGWAFTEGQWNAGTFLEDGTYVVCSGVGHIVSISNVHAGAPTVSASAPAGGVFADIAVNPLDGKVYGYNHATHRMAWIDPATGAVTDFAQTHAAPNHIGTGSAWFDSFGEMTLYASAPGAGNVQDRFFRVDVGDTVSGLGTGALTELSAGPVVQASDGASSVFGNVLGLQKLVSTPTSAPGLTATYTFRIANQKDDPAGVTCDLTDDLPAGLTCVGGSLVNPYGGKPNAYGGSSSLVIEGLTIPANTIAEISIDVVIPPNAALGETLNQAWLRRTPQGYPAEIPSDNPDTPEFADPTPLVVVMPEPAALWLLILGCLILARRERR
jgi:uncharacterized repeat protein (TIGR01451 family)